MPSADQIRGEVLKNPFLTDGERDAATGLSDEEWYALDDRIPQLTFALSDRGLDAPLDDLAAIAATVLGVPEAEAGIRAELNEHAPNYPRPDEDIDWWAWALALASKTS